MAELLALLSSIMVGASDFGGGFFTRRLSAFAVIGGSATAAALIFLAIGIFAEGPIVVTPTDVKAGLVTGCAILFATYLYFTALTKGRMGVIGGIVTLMVLVPLAFSLMRGDSLSTRAIVGIVVTLAGAIMLGAPEMRGKLAISGVLMAVGAALLYGLGQISLGTGAQGHMFVVLFFSEAVQAVIVGVIALTQRSLGGRTRRDLLPLAALGAADAIAFTLFATATTTGNLAVVSVLGSLDPLVVALLALVVLKERLTRVQVVAFVIVMVGSLMVGRNGG